MTDATDRPVWKAIAESLGAELREATTITGVSGLDHTVQAIAVDDKGGRVIVFAAEPNPRTAALMHGDIQGTMPEARVIVARPILLDLASMARALSAKLGLAAEIPIGALMQTLESLSGDEKGEVVKEATALFLEPIAMATKNVKLPTLDQIVAGVQQIGALDWREIGERLSGSPKELTIPIGKLLEIDNLALDRSYGICPVPLYEFGEADWALLRGGRDHDAVEARLKELGIFQYFFPPLDHLALGVAERHGGTPVAVGKVLELAPALGHPFGKSEIVGTNIDIPEVIHALTTMKMLVEGEMGMEVTPQGTTARATVKFRPREGIVSRVLNVFKVNLSVSPKDFM